MNHKRRIVVVQNLYDLNIYAVPCFPDHQPLAVTDQFWIRRATICDHVLGVLGVHPVPTDMLEIPVVPPEGAFHMYKYI